MSRSNLPANAGEDGENSDYFGCMETKEETGKNHLPETKDRAKGGEEAHGGYAKEVDEEDGEEAVDEAELEDRHGENAKGKTGYDHVRSEPLPR